MNIFVRALENPSSGGLFIGTSDAWEYENLTENALFSVPLIVIAVFVGIAIALLVSVFTKRVLGGMVRKLLAEEALSADSAKTLDELGFGAHFFLCRAVKGNVSLRRVVYCREEDQFLREQEELKQASPSPKKFKSKPFRVDPKTHHFYIPEEQKETAEKKFDEKGTSIVSLCIWLIVSAVLLTVILFALPKLMEWFDKFLGMFGSDSNDIV